MNNTQTDAHNDSPALTALRRMSDGAILISVKSLVQRERELTTQVLRHLAEIERRKLYSDLKYPSLFEYAVGELGYSNGAASRRISAMRLVKELPEVEKKIESGALNLCNISRAQTFFREVKRTREAESAKRMLARSGAPLPAPAQALTREDKAAVLQKLEHTSTREGESILFALNPTAAASRERVRQVDLERTEFCFTADAKFKAKLQYVRSLLGLRGSSMRLAELMSELVELGIEKLEEKKFGKRRMQAERATSSAGSEMSPPGNNLGNQPRPLSAPTPTRYIPQSVKHAVWRSAGGQCSCCGSQNNLQFDHIQPVALGGASTPDNLQLLCGSCNLRRGVKTFGVLAMRRS